MARTATVNVRPLTEVARTMIRHPSGVGFSDNEAGTAWPDDQFTTRRINDGDIEVVVPPEAAPPPPRPPRAK
jgi:hypothetical protein